MAQEKPEMTVIAKRPVKLVSHLASSEGVLVSMRLANGEDVHVPLQEVFALFERHFIARANYGRFDTGSEKS